MLLVTYETCWEVTKWKSELSTHTTRPRPRRLLKEITYRMDSAWAQIVDPDTNTIKLKEWLAVSKCLHCIVTHKAIPAVVAAVVAKVNKSCGVELFMNLLQKFSKSLKEKTLMYMTANCTKYKDSDSKTILDYLDKFMDARNKLNGMSDEVFMVHVAEGLLGTELNDYIKHVMNSSSIELDRAERLHRACHEHRWH